MSIAIFFPLRVSVVCSKFLKMDIIIGAKEGKVRGSGMMNSLWSVLKMPIMPIGVSMEVLVFTPSWKHRASTAGGNELFDRCRKISSVRRAKEAQSTNNEQQSPLANCAQSTETWFYCWCTQQKMDNRYHVYCHSRGMAQSGQGYWIRIHGKWLDGQWASNTMRS